MRWMLYAVFTIAFIVLVMDDVRLRLKLEILEKEYSRGVEMAERTQQTNKELFRAIYSCRDTVLAVADSSRVLTEFKLTKEADVIRRSSTADPFLFFSKGEVRGAAFRGGIGGP